MVIAEVIVYETSENKVEKYFIVNNKNDTNEYGDIRRANMVSVGAAFAEGLFEAVVNNRDIFFCNDFEYKIYEYFPTEIEPKFNRFRIIKVDFTENEKPQPVYVYRKTCRCISCYNKYGFDSIDNRAAIIPAISTEKRTFRVNVEFCNHCANYFIDQQSLDVYQKKYGVVFFIELRNQQGSENNLVYSDFNSDSILSRYGYSAGDNSPDTETRRLILTTLIESGIAQKYEIQQTLSEFIKLRGERCYKAVKIWRDDLLFVNEYKINQQGEYRGFYLTTKLK